MKIIKILIGLILVFVFHIPRLLYLLLQLSYSYVFKNEFNLTANPKEHLKRAKKLLRQRKNSLLLYVALELRFALERMVHHQLILTNEASNQMLKKYDPLKKRKNISNIDPNADYEHDIFWINRETGERIPWGTYRPLDIEKVARIKGMLGDLLHPKEGISLGIADDPWYIETRKFLKESLEYLDKMYKNNEPFFLYKDLDQFELKRINDDKVNVKII